jgi:hypothetical protein
MDAEVQGFQTGDVVFLSWGYSMVLPTWWKVVKGAGPGKFAQIQRLESVLVQNQDGYGQQGRKLPQLDNLEPRYPVERRKVSLRNGVLGVKTEYGEARLWDGQPKYYDSCD